MDVFSQTVVSRLARPIVFVRRRSDFHVWEWDLMAASILYFGPDEWSRVQVLKSAGYSVRECHTLEELESALETSPQPDAVMVNGVGHAYAHPAAKIIHTQMALAPVIIFPSQDEPAFEKSADLVIPPLTPPEEWLGKNGRADREESCIEGRRHRDPGTIGNTARSVELHQGGICRHKSQEHSIAGAKRTAAN